LIKQYNQTSQSLFDILDVIKSFKESFYFTENNERIFVTDEHLLKKLLRQSAHIFYEDNDINSGLVLVWKSKSSELTRYYVKLLANNEDTARRLLTLLLWNTKKDLFIKIKKDSLYLKPLRQKRFEFSGGRGSELLLKKRFVFSENNSKVFIKNNDQYNNEN